MNTLYETKRCIFCQLSTTVEVDAERLKAWGGGVYVQVAFDNLDAQERELLITGTHPECWDKNFGDEEDSQVSA